MNNMTDNAKHLIVTLMLILPLISLPAYAISTDELPDTVSGASVIVDWRTGLPIGYGNTELITLEGQALKDYVNQEKLPCVLSTIDDNGNVHSQIIFPIFEAIDMIRFVTLPNQTLRNLYSNGRALLTILAKKEGDNVYVGARLEVEHRVDGEMQTGEDFQAILLKVVRTLPLH
jgi:hypothetical protein